MPPSSSITWIKVGSLTHHLISTQEGLVFVHTWNSRSRKASKRVLQPLDLLKMLPYFLDRSIGADLAVLLCAAGDAQSFESLTVESLTAAELWSAIGDAVDEANRHWEAGNRPAAREAEARATAFRVRHRNLLNELEVRHAA